MEFELISTCMSLFELDKVCKELIELFSKVIIIGAKLGFELKLS